MAETTVELLEKERSSEELVSFKPTGLHFKSDLSIEEWQGIGNHFISIERSRLWWIGDWVNYGESRYGEKYAQALQSSDYDYGTLRNASYVARKIPPHMRSEKLTWSHHYAIAQLDEKDQASVLELAEAEGLSVKDTRKKVLEISGKELPPPKLMFEAWWEWLVENEGHAEVLAMGREKLARQAWDAGQENK